MRWTAFGDLRHRQAMRSGLVGFLVTATTAVALADTCPALRVPTRPAKFESVSSPDAAVPTIVDFGDHSMDAFFEKLARVARGGRGTVLRIGTYGDSNWTNDRTAGEIRRRLQLAFGDAGHGFVAFGDPWGWYHHQNI